MGIEIYKNLKYIVLAITFVKIFENLDIPRGVNLLKY